MIKLKNQKLYMISITTEMPSIFYIIIDIQKNKIKIITLKYI